MYLAGGIEPGVRIPLSPPGSLQPDRNMFGFEKSVESLHPQFAAPTALLDSSEGRLAGRWQWIIDSDNAGLKGFGESKHSSHVACKYIGAQSVDGVVRKFDHVGFLLER